MSLSGSCGTEHESTVDPWPLPSTSRPCLVLPDLSQCLVALIPRLVALEEATFFGQVQHIHGAMRRRNDASAEQETRVAVGVRYAVYLCDKHEAKSHRRRFGVFFSFLWGVHGPK